MVNRVKIESDIDGDSHHSDEEFGSWGSTTYTTYMGLSYSKLGFDEEVDFTPVDGETYYLVDVLYSTGDSFGHAEGCRQIIGVFKDEEEADNIRKMIEDDYKYNPEKPHSLNYKGRDCLYTGTWKGYFETFGGCNIYPLVYKGK